jgi:hypothetical protein
MRPRETMHGRLAVTIAAVALLTCCSRSGHPLPAPEKSSTQGDAGSTAGRLREDEAVRLAEAFVRENGYTNVPATRSGDSLSRESIDNDEPEKRLAKRKDTLLPKACAVSPPTAEVDQWTVLFCYNTRNERFRVNVANFDQMAREAGRAVTMDLDGSHLRVQHQDILFDQPGMKRLP